MTTRVDALMYPQSMRWTVAGSPAPELDQVDECYRARAKVRELSHRAVLEALDAGYSVPQVAKAAGTSRQAVYALVARLRSAVS